MSKSKDLEHSEDELGLAFKTIENAIKNYEWEGYDEHQLWAALQSIEDALFLVRQTNGTSDSR